MAHKSLKPRTSELKLLKRVSEEAGTTKQISSRQIDELTAVFGKRFERALQAVNEIRVKKYIFRPNRGIVWIVVGRERDYQIIPTVNFCSCDDYYFRVLDGEVHLCYHLIAQRIAEALERYETFEESDELYEPLMREWKKVRVKRVLMPDDVRRLRDVMLSVLSSSESATISQLREEAARRNVNVATRHLAIVLSTDPKRRFRCEEGKWSLTTNKSQE